MDFKDKIRNIPDYPKPGVLFKDVTTLLKDGEAFKRVIDTMVFSFQDKQIDSVVSMESRGFMFGAPLAYRLGCGFIPARKKGKLPGKTVAMEYETEYSKDSIEIHLDAIQQGQKVLVVDDLLATGGTAKAVAEIVEKLGGQVIGFAFLIELPFLKGREKLSKYNIFSMLKYEAGE